MHLSSFFTLRSQATTLWVGFGLFSLVALSACGQREVKPAQLVHPLEAAECQPMNHQHCIH